MPDDRRRSHQQGGGDQAGDRCPVGKRQPLGDVVAAGQGDGGDTEPESAEQHEGDSRLRPGDPDDVGHPAGRGVGGGGTVRSAVREAFTLA